jgi:serine/threonine-protein kinase
VLIESATFYLFFVIAVALVTGFLVWRNLLPLPKIFTPLILAILLLPAPAVYIYGTYLSSIPEVVVPDLTGQPLERAFKLLAELRLQSRHSGQVFDTSFAEGQVVSQRPEAGRKVKIGRTVYLITSSGKRHVAAPNLLGRPITQVEAVLAVKGLQLGEVQHDYTPELDPGIVLTQAPLPDEDMVAPGYVNVTISSTIENEPENPELKEVPPAELPSNEEGKKSKGGLLPWW